MENRSLSVVAYLIVLLAMPFAVVAAESAESPDQQGAWQARLDKAAELQARGKALQADADQILAQKNTECATLFFINDCRNAAAREHLKVIRETRRLEIEGNAIEREVKREQARERDRRRIEAEPRRAADLVVRQTESITARQEAEDRIAATRSAKESRAAEGERRKVAEAEKLSRKQAEHDARVARKMREAEQRAVQAAEKK